MDRRCKLISVPMEALRLFFGGYRDHGQMIAMDLHGAVDHAGQPVAIPDDYTVDDVHAEWSCQAVMVRIRHPSFDDIPPGQRYPELQLAQYVIVLPVVVSDDPNVNTDKVTVNAAS